MTRLREIIRKHWDTLVYLIFGVLTTVVNYIVYLPCYNLLHWPAAVSNCAAWVAAVAFAFVTNKPLVFHSHDWSKKTVMPELAKFVTCRLASGAMETVVLLLTVDILGWSGNLMKLTVSLLVVIVNYIASKLLVFK